MIVRTLFVFIFIPITLISSENEVPMGVQGNRLIFKVKNQSKIDLKKLNVSVQSNPEWIRFENTIVNLDCIPAKGSGDAEFLFEVLSGESGRVGTVQLTVADQNGNNLEIRDIRIRAALEINEMTLFPPFPNPANPSVHLKYVIPEIGLVSIVVFNVLGQDVRTLYRSVQAAGQWDIVWDGKDGVGRPVPSGVYMILFQTTIKGKISRQTEKVLIKR